MLLHSKSLYRLYPEQTWLANLLTATTFNQISDQQGGAGPKFCKPRNTAYKLRQMQAKEEPPTGLEQLLRRLSLRKVS